MQRTTSTLLTGQYVYLCTGTLGRRILWSPGQNYLWGQNNARNKQKTRSIVWKAHDDVEKTPILLDLQVSVQNTQRKCHWTLEAMGFSKTLLMYKMASLPVIAGLLRASVQPTTNVRWRRCRHSHALRKCDRWGLMVVKGSMIICKWLTSYDIHSQACQPEIYTDQ